MTQATPTKTIKQHAEQTSADLNISGKYSLTYYSSLDPLKDVWQQLESLGQNYCFQTYDWINCWQKTVGNALGVRPCPVLVETIDGQPMALLPLGQIDYGRATILTWLGGTLADYQSGIFADAFLRDIDAADFTSMWRAICTELPPFDAILLERQPATIGDLANPLVMPGSIRHSCNAHSTALDGSLETFVNEKRGKKWRRTERRSKRLLEEHGAISFTVAETDTDIERQLATLFEQKSSDFRALGVDDLFADTAYQEFVLNLTRTATREGFAKVFGLCVGDRLIATGWGVAYRGRFYYLLTSYEKNELSRLSPGNQLLLNLFAWSMTEQISLFDFCAGDEPYKTLWCDRTLHLSDYIAPITLQGRIFVWREMLARKAKNAIKDSPQLFSLAKRARKLLPH